MEHDIEQTEQPTGTDRRKFLLGAAAAATGAAGALTVLSATPAGAGVNPPLSYFPIPPVRVFDSRTGKAQEGTGNKGAITRGDLPRQITFGTDTPEDLIPEAAEVAVCTLTITNTVATGALAVTRANVSNTTTSNINWFGPNQILATQVTTEASLVTLGANTAVRAINVHCVAGTAGVSSTHFIIDCVGYFATLT